jgi:hypothetical protein
VTSGVRVPLSKKQQKKLAKKEMYNQKKAEKKIVKKENSKVQAAKKKAAMDEMIGRMTPEELEEYREKSRAKTKVTHCGISCNTGGKVR